MYPHAAISDIQYVEAEWDRNHLSDKCYLIFAVVQTMIEVCLLSFMTKALGFLWFCSCVISGILLSSQLSWYQNSPVFSCAYHCPVQWSVFLFAFTSTHKKNLLELQDMPQFDHWPTCTPSQLRPSARTISWALPLSSDSCCLLQLSCLLAGFCWTVGSQGGQATQNCISLVCYPDRITSVSHASSVTFHAGIPE